MFSLLEEKYIAAMVKGLEEQLVRTNDMLDYYWSVGDDLALMDLRESVASFIFHEENILSNLSKDHSAYQSIKDVIRAEKALMHRIEVAIQYREQ